MSVALFTAVWKRRDLRTNEKIVLLKLADCANDQGGSCFPKLETICGDTTLSVRTVRRALDKLVARGLVSRRDDARDRRRTQYQLNLSAKLTAIPTSTNDRQLGVTRAELPASRDRSIEDPSERPVEAPRARATGGPDDHRTCDTQAAGEACHRGLCVPRKLIAEWRAQLARSCGSEAAADVVIRDVIAQAIAGFPAVQGLRGFELWAPVWKARFSSRTPATRPAARSTASDWGAECQELHGGTCTRRYQHELLMQDRDEATG